MLLAPTTLSMLPNCANHHVNLHQGPCLQKWGSLLSPWSSTIYVAISTCRSTVEGWSLQLKLHAITATYIVLTNHISSSCEQLPWHSKWTQTHLNTLLALMTRSSQVISPTVMLKPWECTLSCYHWLFPSSSSDNIKSIKNPSHIYQSVK